MPLVYLWTAKIRPSICADGIGHFTLLFRRFVKKQISPSQRKTSSLKKMLGDSLLSNLQKFIELPKKVYFFYLMK